MLFTSPVFFCIYLPVVIAGFFALSRITPMWGSVWLFLASLVFYAYWMPEFTALLLGSILWNFWVGSNIGRELSGASSTPAWPRAKAWLIVGVAIDLAVLAYFKYAEFFLTNLNALLGQEWNIGKVILPIGISFFTFTQIAFLADAYLKGTREYKFAHFGLFVTYFPHLIAGPVLHHAQMMPQFRDEATFRLNPHNFAAGLLIFAGGLFKKVVLADGISPYADAIFNAAEAGLTLTAVEAWIGALAYTFQLYFDFSGYSDMAIGLSWMLNVRLPYNFNSPYKSLSISDFWRRWHMTLSAFLRDYLYVPLGGNRKGSFRRYLNLLVTMILGGLWHGASWTFVFWGALHGVFLAINHAFQRISGTQLDMVRSAPLFKLFAWCLTFLCVVLAWVFFRAVDFPSALRILSALVPSSACCIGHGLDHPILWNQGLAVERAAYWLAFLGAIALLIPNSNRIGELALANCRSRNLLSPLLAGTSLTCCALLVLINGTRDAVSAFIYFNF